MAVRRRGRGLVDGHRELIEDLSHINMAITLLRINGAPGSCFRVVEGGREEAGKKTTRQKGGGGMARLRRLRR